MTGISDRHCGCNDKPDGMANCDHFFSDTENDEYEVKIEKIK